MKAYRYVSAVGWALALAGAVGCSFSYSSESISNSISGSSESISHSITSSSPESGDDAEALRYDFRVFTTAHVRGGGSAGSLRSGLSELAARHGVTDWESDVGAFVAIGEGLAAAGAARSDLGAYERELAGRDAARAAAMERGWRDGAS